MKSHWSEDINRCEASDSGEVTRLQSAISIFCPSVCVTGSAVWVTTQKEQSGGEGGKKEGNCAVKDWRSTVTSCTLCLCTHSVFLWTHVFFSLLNPFPQTLHLYKTQTYTHTHCDYAFIFLSLDFCGFFLSFLQFHHPLSLAYFPKLVLVFT
jgi:hypothetical protein